MDSILEHSGMSLLKQRKMRQMFSKPILVIKYRYSANFLKKYQMSQLKGKNDGVERKAQEEGNSCALALLPSSTKLLPNSEFMLSTANETALRTRKGKQTRNP